MKHIALAVLAFAVPACSARVPSGAPGSDAAGVPPNRTADYLCGPAFARATFSDGHATLDVEHRRYPLKPVRSASGARYAVDQPPVELWEHQDEATITVDGERLPTCVLVSQADLMPFLIHREWVVEDVDRGGIIDSSRITMSFSADGTLAGLAGCNAYSGHYTLEGSNLTMSPLISTRKACAPALMNQEAAFLAALQHAVRAAPGDHGALVIESSAGGRLLARRANDQREAAR